jgi:hypothetical protein
MRADATEDAGQVIATDERGLLVLRHRLQEQRRALIRRQRGVAPGMVPTATGRERYGHCYQSGDGEGGSQEPPLHGLHACTTRSARRLLRLSGKRVS